MSPQESGRHSQSLVTRHSSLITLPHVSDFINAATATRSFRFCQNGYVKWWKVVFHIVDFGFEQGTRWTRTILVLLASGLTWCRRHTTIDCLFPARSCSVPDRPPRPADGD